jgi:hypothetical protein
MPSIITLTSLALSTTLSVLASAGERSQLVETTFNTAVYNQFIDSVKEIGTPYDVAIDNGRTVIIPVEGNEIDLEGDDKALGVSLDSNHPLSLPLSSLLFILTMSGNCECVLSLSRVLAPLSYMRTSTNLI